MENNTIQNRLNSLRAVMAKEGIAAALFPTADYHNSEYTADFFCARAYLSGFTGSAGTLLVTQEDAYLWTDGRYFIQAAAELDGTGITLMRMGQEGVPEIETFLKEHLEKSDVLAFDGRCVSAEAGARYGDAVQEAGGSVRFDIDLADAVWEDRPALPNHPLYELPVSLCGESVKEKLIRVRKALEKEGADALALSKLDDIMWLTNLRGDDVECNPVALSYAVLTPERFLLFVQEEEITEEVRVSMEAQGITFCDYHEFFSFLEETADTKEIADEIREGILYDAHAASLKMKDSLDRLSEKTGIRLIEGKNPTTHLKAVKNETELTHTRETYLKDSAILCEFLYYVKTQAAQDHMTEVGLAKKLDGMRAADKDFIELSFPTISAYGGNGAIVHYEPTEETDAPVEAKGLYLVDSGGTYYGGTTDVTRTVVMGPLTQEMKKHFTLTTVGMLRMADARFPKGCCGRNVDTLARQALWKEGIDFNHGTGHGVGYMLNVHEGPQNIRWRYSKELEEAEFEAGMLVSDEPGVYIEGSHGVRIENILEVQEDQKTASGTFLKFAHLTYAPIDLDAIDVQYMSREDITLLNDYHAAVYENIAPRLKDDKIREWLRHETRPVG